MKFLDKLDDATAFVVIQFAIEELDQILENEPRPEPGSEEENSEVKRGFARQRDEFKGG
jgi:hypothetical protein